MENISMWVIILFILTTIAAVTAFFKATHFSKKVMLIIIGWMGVHALLSINGFYQNFTAAPPRFMLLIMPALILILSIFSIKAGRHFIEKIDVKALTLMHAIRLPVEITLLHLFLVGLIPKSMTFEGTNFDIISGISAPLIYYLVFVARKGGPAILFAWNIMCMLLLLNVVFTAVLSVPTPFQQFSFDQPNVGVVYFPFVWLPCTVVPIVLFSHLVGLRYAWKLLKTRQRVSVAG